MNARRVRLRIRGHVQGVTFRDSMRREAHRLGVDGWVRNTDDGCVEAEAQGPPEAVAELVAWSRRGPARARVDGVEMQEGEPRSLAAGFTVERGVPRRGPF